MDMKIIEFMEKVRFKWKFLSLIPRVELVSMTHIYNFRQSSVGRLSKFPTFFPGMEEWYNKME